jgi:hypothetical protein
VRGQLFVNRRLQRRHGHCIQATLRRNAIDLSRKGFLQNVHVNLS